MFQKPAFSSNTTSGFGSFNPSTSSASPFGGFKATPGTSAFGAPPGFGASTSAQPSTSGGLFGAPSTSTGLFGSSAATTAAPAFGAATGGFGFGASTSTGGLFGQNNTSGGGLFGGTQNNTAFGAKPGGMATGFGFGSTATTATTGGGLFGPTPTAGTSLFGQQNNAMSGGGLFSNNTTAFGQQAPTGTAHAKYNPAVGTDVVVKGGASQNVIIKHHCITCMKEYETKSLEELRLEDYTAGRKGTAAGGMFGGFQATTENKPLFGGSTAFGQPATTSAPGVFGGGALNTSTGFGQPSTFSFGSNTQNTTNTSGLFGAAKPAFGATATTGTGLFGAASTQAPTFGTSTSSFGFGTNTPNQTTGLFGAKPATTGFGTTATTAFGGFGNTGSLFGAKPQQTTAPAFGSTAPAFGTLSTGFGTTTSTAGGGLFGQNTTFGKPAAQQPAFGFGNTQQNTLGGGLGAGLGANAFGNKPAAAPGFGALGTTMFQQPANNTFRTGLDSGLGGGIFSNTGLGGNALGLGLNANTGTLANNSLSGSAAGNVHEQILTLAARPYGDSPLFKNLLPESSTTAEDVLKPTNPSAVKAVLESSGGYRVGSPSATIKLQVRPASGHDKKSLFDGLEEADASLEDKLCLKPSRKRLVLRQKTAEDTTNQSVEHNNINNRSVEEPPVRPAEPEQDDHIRRQSDYQENHNLETSSDRHGSWLSTSKVATGSWSENEKPIDNEPTPRLYPNLSKELPIQISERRASWLTTKPLRKPLNVNPDSAENSVRELAVRTTDRSHDKENIDTLSVSEEEHVPIRDAPSHPAGVKLTRPGYYTIPSLEEMTNYITPDGRCVVPHLTIGRKNYGNVYYDCEIDVAGLDLDSLVHFLNKEVIVYPEDADKPPVGEGLNRRAIVTLDRIWPRDKTEKRPVTEPDRLLIMDYEGKLRRICDKHDTKFIEYRPQTGSWVFRVEHFSKYGLTDSDEEDDPTPDVLKRQLITQNQLQKSAAIPPKPPVSVTSPGLGGLGLGGLSAPSSGLSHGLLPEDNLLAMHQTSLNLLNGAGKAFDMDTTEDNAESQSLYQDNRAFGVKSPTSELARLEHRQSHNVQLMKASLYADADDISVSTGDQLVPLSTTLLSMPQKPPSTITEEPQILDITPPPVITDEQPMKQLIVRPDTIVLKYHRKVPPFKSTIAGRLDAACIADMSVCRARHSRVGFGPAGMLVFPTSYDSISNLPRNAELCDLGNYVVGRRRDDWSEPVVARLAIGQGDTASYMQEALSRHLETLLEWSEPTPGDPDACPQLRVKPAPGERLQLLQRHLRDAEALHKHSVQFGVSGSYCYEVWKLCDALWGADLENDGVPGTDVQSRVSQYKKLLEWFADTVSQSTDEDLAKPRKGEDEDEADGHSGRVWTLLLGGRILEACKVAKENGDLNMATLIAQSAGDPLFRSLLSRQISLWRECGADKLISSYRLATLRLIAGLSSPRDKLLEVDWLRALHATARYLCPQVPTLEQVMTKYMSFFSDTDDYENLDLSTIEADEMGMKYPLPPYCDEYDMITDSERVRRVLDLRYELLRARSRNTRPTLRPASYTPDPLDYSLCFLLGTWFGNPTVESITGIADQLEACGLWHRAIQTLAYHPNEIARSHLIRGVLCRHAPAQADTSQLAARLQLVRRLQVPEKWLLLAQAYRADYLNLPLIQAEHLAGACQWNAAHKVLLDKLLPEVVLSDNLQSVSPLLEKMNEAAKRHEVSGWESGGQALYHYLHVCEEIRGLVSVASAEGGVGRSGVAHKLEALRPLVSAACRALQQLQPKSARHAAARTEMGSRLVQLALAAGEPPHHLAALLKALKLPPDCTAHAQHKITTDLAEQASELCIESVSSSPISSHHRTTVQS